MLIKQKDPIEGRLNELDRLLRTPKLTDGQREKIGAEVRTLKAGAAGEREAAYHIDFVLAAGKNYAVIHDLRLRHWGRVAQIDHLVIGRFLDVIVIESKNFKTPLRINAAGDFEVKSRAGWKGIESPVEQNVRHTSVLEAVIKDLELAPRRLGFPIARKYHNWVLVSPDCSIGRTGTTEDLLKMDGFGSRLERFRNADTSILETAKVISPSTLETFAQRLANCHQPAPLPDYALKFAIDVTAEIPALKPAPVRVVVCAACSAPLESKVVFFCRLKARQFAGKLLCRECQPLVLSIPTPSCAKCNAPVERKVVEFCEKRSERFGARILCRECQATAAA